MYVKGYTWIKESFAPKTNNKTKRYEEQICLYWTMLFLMIWASTTSNNKAGLGFWKFPFLMQLNRKPFSKNKKTNMSLTLIDCVSQRSEEKKKDWKFLFGRNRHNVFSSWERKKSLTEEASVWILFFIRSKESIIKLRVIVCWICNLPF